MQSVQSRRVLKGAAALLSMTQIASTLFAFTRPTAPVIWNIFVYAAYLVALWIGSRRVVWVLVAFSLGIRLVAASLAAGLAPANNRTTVWLFLFLISSWPDIGIGLLTALAFPRHREL